MASDIEIRIQHTDIFQITLLRQRDRKKKESGGGEDKQMWQSGTTLRKNTSELNVARANTSHQQEEESKINYQTRVHAFLFDQSCFICFELAASFSFSTTFFKNNPSLIGCFPYSYLIGSPVLQAKSHSAHLHDRFEKNGPHRGNKLFGALFVIIIIAFFVQKFTF